MELASNVARREANARRGAGAFVRYTFSEYSRYCDKTIAQYCTWYAYEWEHLEPYVTTNLVKGKQSIKGYHDAKRPELFFSFIPFDFDSDNLAISFRNAYCFIEYLERQGISSDRFTIWLSGSKGFHVEVSADCFDVSNPSVDILRRVKQLVERLVKSEGIDKDAIDISLYSASRLYRCWGTKHSKTGLYKTPIARSKFTLEYVAQRELWASEPNSYEPEYPSGEAKILLPLVETEREFIMATGLVVDPSLSVISKCPVLQTIMENPEGRELRRQCVGVLTDAYGSPYAVEVERLFEAWRNNPYMDERRMADAEKWLAEYEVDGTLKCKKTCSAMGCSRIQKRTCGTEHPSDHLVKVEPIKPIEFDEAKIISDERKAVAVYGEDRSVHVFDEPIGFGKTTGFIRMLAEDPSLSSLYLCPTHSLADQVVQDMEAAGIDSVIHLKSREKLIADDELDCPYSDEISAIAANAGGTVTKAVCSKCPRFPANVKDSGEDPCEYYIQYDDLVDRRVVVGMHHHANEYVYTKTEVVNRSFLLVDENPIEAFSGEVRAVAVDIRAVLHSYGPMAVAALQAPPEAPKIPTGEGRRRGIFGAARAATEAAERAMKERVQDARYTEKRRAIDNFVWDAIELLLAGSPLSFQVLDRLQEVGYYPAYIKFLNRVIELSEYPAARRLKEGYQHLAFPDLLANAIEVRRLGLAYDPADNYYYPRALPDCKIVILDATADEGLYRRMAGERELVYNKLPLIRQSKATIIQVTNSGYSKSRIESSDDTLERLAFVARSLRSTYEDAEILCVVPKQLKDRVTEVIDNRKTRIDHYGNLRGKNEYQNFDFQVILGGFFIPNKAVVANLAKVGIFGISEDMLESSTIVLRSKHVARDGSSYFSQRKAYRTSGRADCPFHIANLILLNRAKAEVVQAVRVRLYHGAEDKTVYVLTNIGLGGIYADRFVTLDDLTLDLEEASGMKDELLDGAARRSAAMESKFYRMPIDHLFKSEDLNADYKRGSEFVKYLVSCGSASKVSQGSYRKLADIGEGVTTKSKDGKAVVFARLDAWFAKLTSGSSFGIKELSEAGNTQSVAYVREWLQGRLTKKEVTKSGEARATKYHKIKRVFVGLGK